MTPVVTIAAIALRRLWKGKAIWIAAAMSCLPIIFVLLAKSRADGERIAGDLFTIEQLLLVVVPPMLIATAISDELDDRTTAYLWSRPIPRWAVLAGKLLALAPIAVVLVLASWIVAGILADPAHSAPPLASTLALAAGGLAIAAIATGIATLVPKHGIALTITYFLFFDLPVGVLPASLRYLSVTHHVRSLAGVKSDLLPLDPSGSAGIVLAIIACVWFAIALLRIRRLEA